MSPLTVAEAQARLISLATPVPVDLKPLAQLAGYWLAQDVVAMRSQPAVDLSAMDGYAVRFADLPGPWRIVGASAAGGEAPEPVGRGEAARIFTGAPLPEGADTVIIQEDVAADDGNLSLTDAPPPFVGKNVRKIGSDFAEGQTVMTAGTRLSAAHVALAALAGHGVLPVYRSVRIALLSTGSELVPAGEPVPPGKLPASNSLMLAAMLRDLPCEVEDLGLAPDDLDGIRAALGRAAGADIIVTTGGASVGDHDLVKPALAAAGGEVDFWKVAMRPGKPLICGTLGEALFVGLPGNPVSAFVTATLFLLPLVRHMMGSHAPLPVEEVAQSGAELRANGKRAEYLRAHLDNGVANPVYHQDSAATHALSLANCLIVRDIDATACTPGDPVRIIRLGL